MTLIYIILVCALLSSVECKRKHGKSGKSRDKDDDGGNFEAKMQERTEEMKQFYSGKMAEMKDSLEATLGQKLNHITDVVEAIRERQQFLEYCNDDKCGDNGTCNLSDDGEGFMCDCDEGYVGEYCEITGPCHVELYNVQQEPVLLGREFPRCDDDGSYAGMQFNGTQAFCVTAGKENISGYSVNRSETGDNMNCQCARDEFLIAEEGKSYNCLPNGNYPQTACDDSWCWCQDWQGQQYGERVASGALGTALNC